METSTNRTTRHTGRAVTWQGITQAFKDYFITDAQSMGFTPGEWPERLEAFIGNKLPFMRTTARLANNEIAAVIYQQAGTGITLKVYNA